MYLRNSSTCYKLHGIVFNGRKLVIEKTKTPLKKTTGKNKQAFLQSQSPATDFEMETFESFPPIQKIGARRAFSFLRGTKNIFFFWLWRRGVVVITTAQLHSAKPELRFCAGSNPARVVSEIRDGEYLWRWSWLEIRLNILRQSTIPQKQFIIISSSWSTGSFRNAVLPKKSAIAPFSDSIPKGMNKGKNKQVNGGCIYIKVFPGAKLTELSHYLLLTLGEYSYDAVSYMSELMTY